MVPWLVRVIFCFIIRVGGRATLLFALTTLTDNRLAVATLKVSVDLYGWGKGPAPLTSCWLIDH